MKPPPSRTVDGDDDRFLHVPGRRVFLLPARSAPPCRARRTPSIRRRKSAPRSVNRNFHACFAKLHHSSAGPHELHTRLVHAIGPVSDTPRVAPRVRVDIFPLWFNIFCPP